MATDSEFWRVNSYSYPNPFSDLPNALQAWETLKSFVDAPSYSGLKEYWSSGKAPRLIKPHAVESWKATFEEFGLLYVLSRSDEITITPAGRQLLQAAETEHRDDFVWLGLNLLLRYPLSGPPRRSRGPRYEESDLLLYWFFFAALRELSNEFWWTELERVLCHVFTREEAADSIAVVRDLRSGSASIEDYPAPSSTRGAFYNSLNQVVIHAGMHQMLLQGTSTESLYLATVNERHHWIGQDWLAMVDRALGTSVESADCEGSSAYIARMPAAPTFDDDEEGYFSYLGAEVPSLASAAVAIETVKFEGGLVPVLRESVHYEQGGEQSILGAVASLCRLAPGQRLILSHDLERSFIVDRKELSNGNKVRVFIRRARPIVNSGPLEDLLGSASE